MVATLASDPSLESCAVNGIHYDTIARVQSRMPPPHQVSAMADLFKLFGDGTRAGILWALSEAEMCVCDLCALLQMKQPAVSHQLRHLKQARIVKSRREGKVVFYSLDDNHITRLLALGMAHIREMSPDE